MSKEFRVSTMELLTHYMMNNVLVAGFEQLEVLESFSLSNTALEVSPLTIQVCDEGEYSDEEELLMSVCNEVTNFINADAVQSDVRDSVFHKVCDVVNTIIADLRLAVKEELKLVERDVITIEPAY
ncbi:hypothetical protein HWV00_20925 (plasmid) [Moritella sp. 24]|uniref:hypothetical protein n=1 Tax=Moritella sp. 24 TaxID=2746230 RepID=UPI001BA5C9AF|nr:hypothetical protein [Moritella sp. 24]QUM78738.1 hypothetical protein HWV00_20925 [Moritella sp. 24]